MSTRYRKTLHRKKTFDSDGVLLSEFIRRPSMAAVVHGVPLRLELCSLREAWLQLFTTPTGPHSHNDIFHSVDFWEADLTRTHRIESDETAASLPARPSTNLMIWFPVLLRAVVTQTLIDNSARPVEGTR